MSTLRKAVFLAVTLAALPARADTVFKDRIHFENFPREIHENDSIAFKGQTFGGWKYGWCAVTFPDGETGDFDHAEVTKDGFLLSLKFEKGKGVYVVEFMVKNDGGPAVGGIFKIFVDVPFAKDPEVNYEWDKRPASEIEKDVFDRINAFREGRKLSKLAADEKVAVLCREDAHDMIENHYFAHLSPTAGDMAARARVKYGWKNVIWGLPAKELKPRPGGYVFIGEDIAFDNNPAAAVEAWLGSPGHRAAFLNRFVTGLAVGVEKWEGQLDGEFHRRIYFVAAFTYYCDTSIAEAEKEAAARREDAKAQPSFDKAKALEGSDLPAAAEAYDDVVAKFPGTKSAEKAAARAAELRARPDWDEVVKTTTARREAKAWLERARMLLKNDRKDGAREWLDRIVKEHAGTPEAEEAARLLKSLDAK